MKLLSLPGYSAQPPDPWGPPEPLYQIPSRGLSSLYNAEVRHHGIYVKYIDSGMLKDVSGMWG